MPARFRATLSYDGTDYLGFQRQASGSPTIQGTVEKVIAAVTGQEVTIIGAGRTDTGVHAVGQVIAFDVEWKHPDEDLLRAINATLPDDIALQDIAQQPGFHPRFDALSRVYQYYILRSRWRQPLVRDRAWHIYGDLDGDQMQVAAAMLIGTHDFATFGQPPQGENTVREVIHSLWSVRYESFGTVMVYHIEANAFLQHMVRSIVGTLVDVGRGKITLPDFERKFKSANRSEAGTMAPPHGLVLEEVLYS